jgi:hypothetical protein
MPATELKPQHRKLYIRRRVPQIKTEMAALKIAIKKVPKTPPPNEAAYERMHHDHVFNKVRFLELKKELAALKAEKDEIASGFLDD